MKKILSFILITAMIFGLAGCGKKSKLPASYTTIPAPNETTTTIETTTQKETETVAADDETEEVSDSDSEEADADDEMPEEERKIAEGISRILDSYEDENGYMPPDADILLEAKHKIYQYAQELASKGVIEDCAYCDEGYSVSFFLNDGSTAVYIPELEEYYSNGEEFSIGVIDLHTFGEKAQHVASNIFWNDPTLFYSNPGKTIKKAFPSSSYNEYDSKATLTDLRFFLGSLAENKVRAIFWRGHGGFYTTKNGQKLVFGTREKITNKTIERYKGIVDEDAYVEIFYNDNDKKKGVFYYGITSIFFEDFMSNVDGGLFFTTACHSAQDGGEMANTLRSKGFDTYVGATEAIFSGYADGVISKAAEYLCEKDEDGLYNTIHNALFKAVHDCDFTSTKMANDIPTLGWKGKGAAFDIIGDDDFRLVETSDHHISRSSEAPKEQEATTADGANHEEISESTSEGIIKGSAGEQKDLELSDDEEKDLLAYMEKALQGAWYCNKGIIYFNNGKVTQYIVTGDSDWQEIPPHGVDNEGVAEYTFMKKEPEDYHIEQHDYIYYHDGNRRGRDQYYVDTIEPVGDGFNETHEHGYRMTIDSMPNAFWSTTVAWKTSWWYYQYDGDRLYWDENLLLGWRISGFSEDILDLSGMIPVDAVEYKGHYYRLYKAGTVSGSSEALQFCQQQGGHLATITSAEENAFLYNYILSQGCDSAYFGLTDGAHEGEWAWCTGEEVSYQNWGSGEANDQDENEDWAMFYYKFSDGTWNDGVFAENSAFICEWGD